MSDVNIALPDRPGSKPLDKPAQHSSRNLHLQVLRGVAAVMVVIYHAAHFTSLETSTPWLAEVFGPRLGFYGVLMFFVLSGYLMQGAIQRYRPTKFLAHRLIRLFPTFWGIFIAMYLVQSIRLGAFQDIPWAALTLLPLGEMYRPLGVEWTLLYEVFFYVVCTALCFTRRSTAPFFVGWLVLVLASAFAFNQYGTVFQPNFLQIPFSLWNIGFIAGALVAHMAPKLSAIRPGTWLIIAVPVMLMGEFVAPGPRILFAVLGLCCILLTSINPLRANATNDGLGMRAWVLVGEYSYGLYLAHSMAIQIALQYVPSSQRLHPFAAFAGILGFGLAIGLIAGKFDSALYRQLKRLADRILGSGHRQIASAVAESDESIHPPSDSLASLPRVHLGTSEAVSGISQRVSKMENTTGPPYSYPLDP